MIAFHAVEDGIRSAVLSVGVGSVCACVTMAALYLRHPSPRMPRAYVVAIVVSWVLLSAALDIEIASRWGEPLTWRWIVGLVAYLTGMFAFFKLASHIAGRDAHAPDC